MSSFQDLDETRSQYPWGRSQEEFRAVCVELQDRESLFCRLRETPLGFFLRVIVKEFHPNLEKTKSSVLSVILINLCF